MPEDTAATAAPESSVQTPPAPNESVQRLESMPEPKQPLFALEDALSEHFKDSVTEEPAPKTKEEQTQPKPPEKAKDAPKALQTPSKTIPEKAPEPKAEPKIIDPETIKPHKELKGDALAGWNTLKKNSILLNEERKRLLEKNKALEATVASKGGATQKEIDALKAQIEELRPFRQMVEIQHDPDFVKEYETPLEEKKAELAQILRDEKISDDFIKKIDFTNKDTVNKTIKTFRDAGLDTQADELRELASEIQALTKKRGKTIEESKVKFKEYSKTKADKDVAKRTEEEAIQNQVVEASMNIQTEDGKYEFPFLVMQQVPEGATKEQGDQIQKHNGMVEHLQGKINEELRKTDPQSRAINVVRAIVGAVRDAQLKGVLARNAELEAEIARISTAGGERKSAVTSTKVKTGEAQSSDDALAESFPAAMARHR